MKKTIFLLIATILLVTNCAIINKGRATSITLKNSTKERIVLVGTRYSVFFTEAQVIQGLEAKETKSKEDLSLLKAITSNPMDTLSIEMVDSNLAVVNDYQKAIYPLAFDFLKNGQASIIDNRTNEFYKRLEINTIKGTYGGKQVHFSILDDTFLTYLISLGE
jgi:hypothetical protein